MSHMYPEGAPQSFEDQSHIGESNAQTQAERCRKEHDGHTPDPDTFTEVENVRYSKCRHCGRELVLESGAWWEA